MSESVLERIRELLRSEGAEVREVHHAPTRTSEESARARGESIEIGGKALLLKGNRGGFRLFVMSAARKLDSAAIRRELNLNKIRFASKEELDERTGLVPGSVSPFGEPIFDFPLYADESVLKNDKIAFNAGSLTDSIIMKTGDWQRIAQPVVFSFSKDAD